jgi:hypothetical protein
VQEVSKVRPESDIDPAGGDTEPATGILAGADRVVRLRFLGRELAHATQFRASSIKGTYELDGERYHIEWVRWAFPELYWAHTSALLVLQGVSLQQALPGWLVLAGDRLPAHSPRSGAKGVVLAEINDPPANLTHRQLFELLLPEAGGACAPDLF